MRDQEAQIEARRRWERGAAWLPKAGWRKIEGGPFYPSEVRLGEEVFAVTPENPTEIRRKEYMYEVGRYETKGKKTSFVVLGRGMTWEEAFESAKT